MKLAEVIHKAFTDPRFRLALESGTVGMADVGLSVLEMDALSEVLRHSKRSTRKNTGKLLPDIYACWRE
jgi:hypothetical protein